MSKEDVAKLFREMGALSQEKAVSRVDIMSHIGISELPQSIANPLGRMKKSGEILTYKKTVITTIGEIEDIRGVKRVKHQRKREMDYMFLKEGNGNGK